MPSHVSPNLTDLHAVMDEVSAMQQDERASLTRQQLIDRVQDTYARWGMDVDPALIEQAVAKRLAPVGNKDTPAGAIAAFDFGWNRPTDAKAWKSRLRARQRITRMARNGLGAASTGAFFVWLWMVLGPVPAALDHPWWFAMACMGSGSAIETWINARARRDRRWVTARKPTHKQIKKWQRSPQALAYLSAVLASAVPLLNADLPQLRQRAQKDEQLAAVRELVK